MDAALRSALAKGDVTDQEYRRKVYTAAANAMERSMAKNPSLSPELLAAQRKKLAAVISKIEDEINKGGLGAAAHAANNASDLDQVRPSKDEPLQPNKGSPEASRAKGRYKLVAEPRIGANNTDTIKTLADDISPSDRSAYRKKMKPKSKPRPFSAMLFGVIIVALIVFIGGFAWMTGAFQSAEQRDTSIPNPPLQLENESSSGNDTQTSRAPALASDDTGTEDGWVALFTPADPTTLGLVRGASAAMQSDPFGDFARIITTGENAAVQIDVPVGVLLELEGADIQISVRARADEGQNVQLAITCDFAELGSCGRTRFNVGQAPSEYLFPLKLPKANQITRGGTLRMQVTQSSGERAINLLNARIRKVE